MNNSLRKKSTSGHVDGEHKFPVERGRRHGHQSGRAPEIQGRGTAAQMDDGDAAVGNKKLSISDSNEKKRFLQLSPEAAISSGMPCTDSKRLSATLEDKRCAKFIET